MTTKSSLDVLDELVNLLCDEILERTDDEITQSAALVLSATQRLQRLRQMANSQVLAARKNLLKSARAQYQKTHENASAHAFRRSVDEMRLLLRQLLAERPDLAGHLTLAARGGSDIPDEDLVDLLDDLEKLGLLEKKN